MSLPVTFEENVKNKLREMVADLIPEDRYNAIVEKAIEDFENVELPNLVKSMLTDKYKALILEELSSPEWRETYRTNGGISGSEAIKKMLVESAPLILAEMIGLNAQRVVVDFQNRIRAY